MNSNEFKATFLIKFAASDMYKILNIYYDPENVTMSLSFLVFFCFLFLMTVTEKEKLRRITSNLIKKSVCYHCQILFKRYLFLLLLLNKYVMGPYVVRCAIWCHLYNLKNVKNTNGGAAPEVALWNRKTV